MASKAEIEAEQLVMDVALDELALTDEELEKVDLGKIWRDLLVDVRIQVKRGAGRQMTIDDYLLPPPPENVIDLLQWASVRRPTPIA